LNKRDVQGKNKKIGNIEKEMDARGSTPLAGKERGAAKGGNGGQNFNGDEGGPRR